MDRQGICSRPRVEDGCRREGAVAARSPRHRLSEGLCFMLHVTCDLCGKELRPGEDHYVVKIEVYAAHDPAELTEADLDEDHMEAVSQLLRQLEDQPDGADLEPPSQRC